MKELSWHELGKGLPVDHEGRSAQRLARGDPGVKEQYCDDELEQIRQLLHDFLGEILAEIQLSSQDDEKTLKPKNIYLPEAPTRYAKIFFQLVVHIIARQFLKLNVQVKRIYPFERRGRTKVRSDTGEIKFRVGNESGIKSLDVEEVEGSLIQVLSSDQMADLLHYLEREVATYLTTGNNFAAEDDSRTREMQRSEGAIAEFVGELFKRAVHFIKNTFSGPVQDESRDLLGQTLTVSEISAADEKAMVSEIINQLTREHLATPNAFRVMLGALGNPNSWTGKVNPQWPSIFRRAALSIEVGLIKADPPNSSILLEMKYGLAPVTARNLRS